MPTKQHASQAEPTTPASTVEFVVGGMTCGSCAARVQRTLGRTDGVAEAEVNLATSRARVTLAEPVPVTELRARVAKIGYSLAPVADHAREGATDAEAAARRWWGYRVVAVAPAALFALITMDRPALMAVTGWRVAALVVATAVEFVVGWPFLREAARRARRRSANMDTLIAVGTLAAYAFSVWELASGGMQVYFETAILLIAFLSLGRYLEARARGRAGQAIRALLELGAKKGVYCHIRGSGCARPGRSGHRPPTLSIASPISASGERNPNARRVRTRSLVLTDSTRALDRPCSRLATIPARCAATVLASLVNAGMRQRRAHASHASSSATACGPLTRNTSRSSSLRR